MSPIIASAELGGEDAGVLALVLLEDVGLDGAAHLREHLGACRAAASGAVGARPTNSARPPGARARRWSMAVFMNMARIVAQGR